jgi:hypothetical protein
MSKVAMAMTIPDPRHDQGDTGHGRRSLMRFAIAAGVALFLFLVGYFLAYGPLYQQEATYPPAGRNLDIENKAAPPPQPTP